MLDSLQNPRIILITVIVLEDLYSVNPLGSPLCQLLCLQPPTVHIFTPQQNYYQSDARLEFTSRRQAWTCRVGDPSLNRGNSFLA